MDDSEIQDPGIPDIEVLDAMPPDAFAAAVAPLFEGAPRFLRRLADARPFGSMDTLFEQARAIAQALPDEEQVELLDAHPRLGAPPQTVSRMSYREQGYNAAMAGQDRERLTARFDRLNTAYEERFGFRYCVFVAGRTRASLVPELTAAIKRRRPDELQRGIDAVIDIARDRHARLVAEAAR